MPEHRMSEPIRPIEPAEQADPAEQAKLSEPAGPNGPIEPSRSSKPTEPSETTEIAVAPEALQTPEALEMLETPARDGRQGTRVVVGVDVGGTFTDTVVTFIDADADVDPDTDSADAAALEGFTDPSGSAGPTGFTDSGDEPPQTVPRTPPQTPPRPPVTAKVLTTPADPAIGVCDGVARALAAAGVAPGEVVSVVHGTTLATNVILERGGVRVAFVTTEGFGDLFRLGREARVEEDRYDLGFRPPPAPLSAGWVVEAPERTLADGRIRRPLTAEAAGEVAARVAALRPDAVAVCLMHSWARSDHEDLLGDALAAALPGTYLALSSRVWPEMREYERAMTTLLCAYVGPVMAGYLDRLTARLAGIGVTCAVRVMDSAGDVMPAAAASALPVRTVESGGAAGMAAAARVAREHTGGLAVSFDMGGTTAKAGIVRDGRPGVTHDFQVGGKGSFGMPRAGTGLPVKGPVVDLSEVGAGGGSIAWVDDGGALRVGPRSAGADPGPACYGRGGTLATVTDANAVLGLFGGGELAGGVRLDRSAAEKAVRIGVAEPLGLGVEDAALAIREIAIAHMATAIRLVTVQRGLDPRGFPMIAFGGAGAMHAADLAARFGIGEVVVPRGAGVMAAHGLAFATAGVEHVRTRPMAVGASDTGTTAAATLAALVTAGRAELGHDGRPVAVRAAVDMRYVGQSHQLTVALGGGAAERDRLDAADLAELAARFRAEHQAAYGSAPDAPVELVTFRVRVTAERPEQPARSDAAAAAAAAEAKSGPRTGTGTVDTTTTHAPNGVAASAGSATAPPDTEATRTRTAGRRSPSPFLAPVHTANGPASAPVWRWDDLERAGVLVLGPAVVLDADATVVVPPGWTAHVTPGSHLTLCHPVDSAADSASREAKP